jgi:hypothetical protein
MTPSLFSKYVAGIATTLAEATSLGELQQIDTQAGALLDLAARAKIHLKAINQLVVLWFRIQRDMGAMIRDMPKNEGGDPDPLASGEGVPGEAGNTGGVPKTLKELGITYSQSSRYQKIANIPEADFEEYCALADTATDDQDYDNEFSKPIQLSRAKLFDWWDWRKKDRAYAASKAKAAEAGIKDALGLGSPDPEAPPAAPSEPVEPLSEPIKMPGTERTDREAETARRKAKAVVNTMLHKNTSGIERVAAADAISRLVPAETFEAIQEAFAEIIENPTAHRHAGNQKNLAQRLSLQSNEYYRDNVRLRKIIDPLQKRYWETREANRKLIAETARLKAEIIEIRELIAFRSAEGKTVALDLETDDPRYGAMLDRINDGTYGIDPPKANGCGASAKPREGFASHDVNEEPDTAAPG